MDISQIVRLAVMAAELWGKYNGKKGEEKLQYALEFIRGIQPQLVENVKRLSEIIEQIEIVKDEFDARGWDILSVLAGNAQRVASRVKSRIEWLSERVSWVRDKIDASEVDDIIEIFDE